MASGSEATWLDIAAEIVVPVAAGLIGLWSGRRMQRSASRKSREEALRSQYADFLRAAISHTRALQEAAGSSRTVQSGDQGVRYWDTKEGLAEKAKRREDLDAIRSVVLSTEPLRAYHALIEGVYFTAIDVVVPPKFRDQNLGGLTADRFMLAVLWAGEVEEQLDLLRKALSQRWPKDAPS